MKKNKTQTAKSVCNVNAFKSIQMRKNKRHESEKNASKKNTQYKTFGGK